LMLVVEWINRDHQHGFDFNSFPLILRLLFCIIIVELIVLLIPATPSQFIYFQF
jgi:hypothetical protein